MTEQKSSKIFIPQSNVIIRVFISINNSTNLKEKNNLNSRLIKLSPRKTQKQESFLAHSRTIWTSEHDFSQNNHANFLRIYGAVTSCKKSEKFHVPILAKF